MITKWFGTFLFNDKGEIESSILFPNEPKEIGDRLSALAKMKILKEERDLISDYKDIEYIIVADERLKGLFSNEVSVNPGLSGPSPEDFGYSRELLHEASIHRSKEQIMEEIKPDRHIIHAINAINELTQSANLLSERLHEWYGIYYPVFSMQVEDKELIKLVSDRISSESNQTGSLGPSKEDRDAIINLARVLSGIYTEREHLENYVRTNVEKLAPNTSKVAGPLIASKLIALTGSLERLARVSASTIQLLGAEKALFRHLKDGSAPPKHGIIFQHPHLHSAPYWQRGKIARALATKISIAAKIDYYKGEYQGDRLNQEFDERIKDIRSRYPSAPNKPKKSTRAEKTGKHKPPKKMKKK